MNLAQTVRVNRLLDLYGNLLTDKQLSIMTEYFCYNNSLGEISENYGISRQAVNYTIKQSLSALSEYEAKLHLCDKYDKVNKIVANCKASGNTNVLESISKILEE